MSSFPAPELPAGRPIKRGSIAQRPNSMFATPASTSPKVMRRNPTTPDVPLPDALTSRQPSVTSLPVDPLKSEHIQVAVRLRPLSEAELNSNQASIWDVEQETGCVHMQTMWQERLKKTTGVTDFQFEHVYLGSDTERIYANGLHQLVWSSMEGYNGTVFAYGQTASGKTYTMMGTLSSRGIIPRAIDDVFAYIAENASREFLLRVSYIEIYNEMIRDLLAPENNDLKILEDKHKGVYVTPLREEIVTSPDQVMQVLQRGEANRHVSNTDFNEHSSRSHCMFQFIIESREKSSVSMESFPADSSAVSHMRPGSSGVRLSTLNLIDLAGSEKAASSADRRREGAYINRSLLTLGTVIARLTEEQRGHIPYRDSKLTRVLQPSLQGNARISVICTISPALSNYEESTNTLKFAQRIKRVVTKASTTEIMDDKALLQKYRSEISQLRTRLAELAEGGEKGYSSQLAAEKLRLEEELQQQQLVRTALKERIDHLTKLILTSSSLNTQAIMNTWQVPAPDGSEPRPYQSKPDTNLSVSHEILRPASTTDMSSSSRSSSHGIEMNSNRAEKNAALLESLEAKDRQIQLLLEEIKMLRTTATTPKTVLPFDQQSTLSTIETQRQEIRRLEEELGRLRSQQYPASGLVSPALVDLNRMSLFAGTKEVDPDRLMELEHQMDRFKEKMDELKTELRIKDQTISHLIAELSQYKPLDSTEPLPASTHQPQAHPSSTLNPSSSTANTQGSTPLTTHKSSNAQFLSQLLQQQDPVLQKTPQKESTNATSLSCSSSASELLIKELERSLDMERRLRLDVVSSSQEKMDHLETELTMAKAELSVAELVQTYLPLTAAQLGGRTGSLQLQALQEEHKSIHDRKESTGSSTHMESGRELRSMEKKGRTDSSISFSSDRLMQGSEELQRYLKKLENGEEYFSP